MATNYFPRKSEAAPMIYAYEDKHDPQLKGMLKVGYTTIGVQERVPTAYWWKSRPCVRMVRRLWTMMCIANW